MYIENDSLSDTQMRWDGSLVRVEEEGNKTNLLISSVNEISKSYVHITGNLKSKEGWIPVSKKFKLASIDTTHPLSGYVNVEEDGQAVLITKSTNTRYKLGATDGRYLCRVPNADDLRAFGLRGVGYSLLDLVTLLYDRSYPTVEEAILSLMSAKAYSVAISPFVALGVSLFYEGLAVYRNNKLIGECDANRTVLLQYKHRYFIEELQELGFKVILQKRAEQ